ncbi:hypothetical protein MVI27_02665 [Chryseobacterium salipaludis]|uniref:hypothetical protein n=1 Tax=Chryseobacterium TaxID=59732 RepID=UPI001FF6BDB5|nr:MULTISPECIES: hypothetical protein [Chryseobacterium]MCJ8497156.1 hypothetical protein [Chryseobacterium salipaludis]MCX3296638.1 hypothetical protein [Planobacterium sp. JC490]
MKNLEGKKILFICPLFHNYEKMIKDKLEKKGAEVVFFAERPYSLAFSMVNNFFKKKMPFYQKLHYAKITRETKEHSFDYLFVIRGYMLPVDFLKSFKKRNPVAKTIMYQWDSQRTNYFRHLIPYFDRVTTFDFEDSAQLGLDYIPLFYTDDVEPYRMTTSSFEQDFFFMGFFFEERYQAVLKFSKFCADNGFSLKPFLFMPFSTRVKYFFLNKKIDIRIVSSKHMDRETYLDILSKSRIMVDVSNPRQTGLAMRVIESLACNTKVITNNIHFKKDRKVLESGMVEFFNLDNINISRAFISKNTTTEKNIVLSIDQWISLIFESSNEA